MAGEFKENLDLVINYTKDFIDAATPVAKQAYEIGLVTLRIDAAQRIVLSLVFAAISIGILLKIRRDCIAAKAKAGLHQYKSDISDHLPLDGGFHILVGCISGIGAFFALRCLFDIWMWTKLIAPELWLAHQAIEKLLK